MKPRKTLSLRREALAALHTDELNRVSGAGTLGVAVGCQIDGPTPTCPVILSHNTYCESFPVLECLVSGIACDALKTT